MRARFFLRLILVVIPTIGLMLLWLSFLPRQGQAAPPSANIPPVGQDAFAQSPSSAATLDPRWMAIVRAQGSGFRGGQVGRKSNSTLRI